jgi:hypothetical protein
MGDSAGAVSVPEFHPEGSVQVWFNAEDYVWFTQEDFNSMYVDDNITSFTIQPDWTLLNIDQQTLTLTYESGQQYSLILGSIADVGTSAEKWYQPVASLIIPADASLQPMFSVRTTPNLWNLRHGLNILMIQLNEQRLQIASIVYSFAKIIDALGNNDMSGIIDDLRKADSGNS